MTPATVRIYPNTAPSTGGVGTVAVALDGGSCEEDDDHNFNDDFHAISQNGEAMHTNDATNRLYLFLLLQHKHAILNSCGDD